MIHRFNNTFNENGLLTDQCHSLPLNIQSLCTKRSTYRGFVFSSKSTCRKENYSDQLSSMYDADSEMCLLLHCLTSSKPDHSEIANLIC